VQPLSIETPQRGVANHLRVGRTTGKIIMCLRAYFFVIFLPLSEFSKFICNIYLSESWTEGR
jgi:hypothetical protein